MATDFEAAIKAINDGLLTPSEALRLYHGEQITKDRKSVV